MPPTTALRNAAEQPPSLTHDKTMASTPEPIEVKIKSSFIESLQQAIIATETSGLPYATFIRRLCGALDVPLESLTNKESSAVQKPTVAANLDASPTSTASFVSKVPTYPSGTRS